MSEFLAMAAFVLVAVTVTGLLITGVVHVAPIPNPRDPRLGGSPRRHRVARDRTLELTRTEAS
jgi:hypothetical protein